MQVQQYDRLETTCIPRNARKLCFSYFLCLFPLGYYTLQKNVINVCKKQNCHTWKTRSYTNKSTGMPIVHSQPGDLGVEGWGVINTL